MTDTMFDLDLPGTGDGQGKAHACAGKSCQVCHAAADAAATEKIAQAVDHADQDWLAMADILLRQAARLGIDFTTDEVMEQLAASGVTTHEPRALGGVVRRLIRSGVIVQVGWTRSRRRHSSPIPVYCGAKR